MKKILFNRYTIGAGLTFGTMFLPTLSSRKYHPVKEYEIEEASIYDNAYVLTWEPYTETGDIGHQSLVYFDKETKDPVYVSFWPSNDNPPIPCMGPFIIYPYNANMMPAYLHDEGMEHDRFPTSVVRINGLDIEAMAEEHRIIEEKVQANVISYALLRHIHFTPIFNAMLIPEFAEHLLANPFSGTYDKDDHEFPGKRITQEKTENCTSTIMRVLAAGGFPRTFFDGTPWGFAPWTQAMHLKYVGGEHAQEAGEDEAKIVVELARTIPYVEDALHQGKSSKLT